MDFKGLAAAAEKIKDATGDVLGKVLDELNSAIPVIHGTVAVRRIPCRLERLRVDDLLQLTRYLC